MFQKLEKNQQEQELSLPKLEDDFTSRQRAYGFGQAEQEVMEKIVAAPEEKNTLEAFLELPKEKQALMLRAFIDLQPWTKEQYSSLSEGMVYVGIYQALNKFIDMLCQEQYSLDDTIRHGLESKDPQVIDRAYDFIAKSKSKTFREEILKLANSDQSFEKRLRATEVLVSLSESSETIIETLINIEKSCLKELSIGAERVTREKLLRVYRSVEGIDMQPHRLRMVRVMMRHVDPESYKESDKQVLSFIGSLRGRMMRQTEPDFEKNQQIKELDRLVRELRRKPKSFSSAADAIEALFNNKKSWMSDEFLAAGFGMKVENNKELAIVGWHATLSSLWGLSLEAVAGLEKSDSLENLLRKLCDKITEESKKTIDNNNDIQNTIARLEELREQLGNDEALLNAQSFLSLLRSNSGEGKPRVKEEVYSRVFNLVLLNKLVSRELVDVTKTNEFIGTIEDELSADLEFYAELLKQEDGVSFFNFYAVPVAALALPTEKLPDSFLTDLWFLAENPLIMPYKMPPLTSRARFTPPKRWQLVDTTIVTAGSARAPLIHLVLFQHSSDKEQRALATENLIFALENYCQHLVYLEWIAEFSGSHFEEMENLAPFYYYPTFPYACAAFNVLRADDSLSDEQKQRLDKIWPEFEYSALSMTLSSGKTVAMNSKTFPASASYTTPFMLKALEAIASKDKEGILVFSLINEIDNK